MPSYLSQYRWWLVCMCYYCCAMIACIPALSPEQRLAQHRMVERLLSQGVWHLRQGGQPDIVRAEAAFALALEIAPSDPRVIDGLGCSALRRGDVSTAKRFFQKAVQLDPGYDRGFAHLAYVAELLGENLEAEKYFRKALQINPLNYRTRNNLAIYLAEARRDQLAEWELLKAQELAGEVEPRIGLNLQIIRGRPGLTKN